MEMWIGAMEGVGGILIINLFSCMLYHDTSFPSLPLLPTSSPPIHFSISLQKGQGSQGYQPNMTYQVAVRLDASPH